MRKRATRDSGDLTVDDVVRPVTAPAARRERCSGADLATVQAAGVELGDVLVAATAVDRRDLLVVRKVGLLQIGVTAGALERSRGRWRRTSPASTTMAAAVRRGEPFLPVTGQTGVGLRTCTAGECRQYHQHAGQQRASPTVAMSQIQHRLSPQSNPRAHPLRALRPQAPELAAGPILAFEGPDSRLREERQRDPVLDSALLRTVYAERLGSTGSGHSV